MEKIILKYKMIKIDESKYFTFLNKLIKDNSLFKLAYLDNKKYEIKEREVESFLVEVEIIDINYSLLILDLPINFLLSYGIIIGEKTQLYEFELRLDNRKKFIANKEVLDLLGDEVHRHTVKKFDLNLIMGKKIVFKFKQSIYLSDYRKKIKRNSNIDLTQIMVVKGKDFLCNLSPNTSLEGFKLLKDLGLGACDLIDCDNFVKSQLINIYDDISQKEVILPMRIYKQKTKILFFNGNLIRNIIQSDFFLKVDKSKIQKLLGFVQVTNFDKDKIYDEIKRINFIKISQKRQNNTFVFPFPIWEENKENENKLFHMADVNTFKKISGVEFRLDKVFLEKLFLQTLNGEKLEYANFFLRDRFLDVFKQNYLEKKELVFSGLQELVLLLLYYENDFIYSVLKEDNKYDVQNLYFEIVKIISILVSCGEKVNFPFEEIKQESNLLNRFLRIKTKQISIYYIDYGGERFKLYDLFLKDLRLINLILRNVELKETNLYYLHCLCLVLIGILKNFEIGFASRIDEISGNYFNKIENFNEIMKVNEQRSELVQDFDIDFVKQFCCEVYVDIYLRKKAYVDRLFIILKKQVGENLFKVKTIDVESLKKEEVFYYVVPVYSKIKEVFKYKWKSIFMEIRKLNIDCSKQIVVDNKIEIVVNKKKFILSDDFFNKKYVYKNYKILKENIFFDIVVRK